MDLLADLRARSNSVPVLVLTARDGLGDRVKALNGGADDYVLKPFEMEELVARIRALLRRPGAALGTVLSAGNLAFDTTCREVSDSGAPIRMPRRELDALELLVRRMGRVVPKDVMGEHIYGFDDWTCPGLVESLLLTPGQPSRTGPGSGSRASSAAGSDCRTRRCI